MLCSNLL